MIYGDSLELSLCSNWRISVFEIFGHNALQVTQFTVYSFRPEAKAGASILWYQTCTKRSTSGSDKAERTGVIHNHSESAWWSTGEITRKIKEPFEPTVTEVVKKNILKLYKPFEIIESKSALKKLTMVYTTLYKVKTVTTNVLSCALLSRQ